MPFPACASNQKNRTFGPKNGDRSAKKASGHSAESENVLFIVDLRNCQCDRPCKTRDGARGTLSNATVYGLGLTDVKAIHTQARELNIAIREMD